eukprot:11156634-Lingulodinium_polyedra.AAC.1
MARSRAPLGERAAGWPLDYVVPRRRRPGRGPELAPGGAVAAQRAAAGGPCARGLRVRPAPRGGFGR